jgi:Flp pilus assembly pilin Flp
MLDYIRVWVDALRRRDEGQAMVEYALILALVSVAAIAVLGPIGDAIVDILNDVLAAL